MNKKMTTREWNLYQLLRRAYEEDADKWISQKEICDAQIGYVWNEKRWDKCSAIQANMKEINYLEEVDKLIIMKNRCFKIAKNEEEAKDAANYYIRKIKKNVVNANSIYHKLGLNGQFKLLSNQGQPIDEKSKAKDCHEVF